MKLNLPNKLTVFRIFMVPVCMLFIVLTAMPDLWARVIAAAVFIITAATDMLDGMIARKQNLVTDLGKFLDPVADKLLIIGTMLAIVIRDGMLPGNTVFVHVMVWVLFIVIARELAVTSLRMIAASSSEKAVIAAAWPGKFKTVTQTAGVLVLLLEPVIAPDSNYVASYIMLGLIVISTVVSGALYFKSYKNFLLK
jgi:CDP-diacylglycerol--glycerol-3-phosphate 3-phosphatidyltransferase